MTRSAHGVRLLTLLATSALLAFGCGGDDDSATDGSDGEGGGVECTYLVDGFTPSDGGAVPAVGSTSTDANTGTGDADAIEQTGLDYGSARDAIHERISLAASPGQQLPPAPEGGELRDLQNFAQGDPSNIDPALAETLQGAQITVLLFDGLTEFDFTNAASPELKPLVASSWEVSEDGLTYTFHVRTDYLFADGTPVKPSDFEFAWNRAACPGMASQVNYLFLPIAGAEEYLSGETDHISGLTSDDAAGTLTVELADPFAEFPGLVSHPVFSPVPAIELAGIGVDENLRWQSTAMMGDGPFVMAEPWQRGRTITLDRNENYSGGLTGEKSVLGRVTFVISSDVESAYTAFDSGDGDLGLIPPGRTEEAYAKYPHAAEPTLGTYFFAINQESQLGGPENLKLRQAISLSIDRQAINDAVYDGVRVNATGITPPGVPGYVPDLCEFCEYDPERAAELVAEWQAEGGSLDAPIIINYNADSGHENVVAIIEAGVQALGFQTTQDPRDPETYFTEMSNGDCEFCRSGWIWDFPSYDNGVNALVDSGSIGGDNLARFSDPAIDEVIAEARATVDDDARNALYREAEKAALDQIALLPINWYTGQIVYTDRVQGLVQNPLQFVNYEQISLG